MINRPTPNACELPPAELGMPQQAPPVDRDAAVPATALGDNPAVQADGLWDTLRLTFPPIVPTLPDFF
ncbi:hypothetical protein PV334_33815 [Streptomyces sp. ME02-7008A-1]|uniref:hypothetical protein n=1 Tax=unclassified Streptomyces TaxID=2593676 RepID=UPI00299FB431|nr:MULTISPECIES: hypothetical protein [unclassified Streptomyces]MDX3186216.1 hypothetical protein [Streptomyces sp. ME02-7008A-1]MDX3307335.1 hypothetical protein [Streptomyces sp. ME02-7008A]